MSKAQIQKYKYTNTQTHKYTNTAYDKVPERPNMWYIFEKRIVQVYKIIKLYKIIFPCGKSANTQIGFNIRIHFFSTDLVHPKSLLLANIHIIKVWVYGNIFWCWRWWWCWVWWGRYMFPPPLPAVDCSTQIARFFIRP